MPDVAGPDISALQLLVPAAEVLIDAVRGEPAVGLLEPAHVSLGYPWLPAADALAAVPRLAAAAASTAAMDGLLRRLDAFPADPRGRVLLHAAPVPAGPVRALAEALGAGPITPHLSIARVLADGDVDAVRARVEPLLPLPVRLETLELTVRVDGRWQRVGRWALAAAPPTTAPPTAGPPATAPPTAGPPATARRPTPPATAAGSG